MGYVIIAATPVVSVGPTAPTAPGAPTFTSITPIGATASWTAATDAVGVTGYEVQIGAGAWVDKGAVLSAILSGLAASSTYVVSVRAYNAAGLRGPASSGTLITSASYTAINFPVLFPRMNAGNQAYTVTWANMGYQHLDAVLLGGGFETALGNIDRGPVVNALQAGNGYGVTCLAIQYMIGDGATTSTSYSMSQTGSPTWYNQVVNNNWFLYANGTSGTQISNFFNAVIKQTNGSDYASVPVNAYGCKVYDELAREALINFQTGAGKNVANYGGFFFDNCSVYCGGGTNQPATADWNRDGTTDTTKDAAVAQQWRNGIKRYVDYIRANRPGLKLVANLDATATTYTGNPAYKDGPTSLTSLWQIWDGVMHENMWGDAVFCITQYGGLKNAVQSLQFYEDFCLDPTLGMAGVYNLSDTGYDTIRTTPYSAFRWSFYGTLVFSNVGYCWTGNGHGGGTSGSYSTWAGGISPTLTWFDEFSADPVTGVCASGWSTCGPNRKWMGTALDPRVPYSNIGVSPYQSTDIYRRRFNGAGGKQVHVFFNASYTTARTLTCDRAFRRLTGAQTNAASANPWNTGALQALNSTISLPAYGGIILIEQ